MHTHSCRFKHCCCLARSQPSAVWCAGWQVAAQGQPGDGTPYQGLMHEADRLRTMVDGLGRAWNILRVFTGETQAKIVYKLDEVD